MLINELLLSRAFAARAMLRRRHALLEVDPSFQNVGEMRRLGVLRERRHHALQRHIHALSLARSEHLLRVKVDSRQQLELLFGELVDRVAVGRQRGPVVSDR